MDLVAHRRRQGVHEDARAQAFGGQLLGLPVSGRADTEKGLMRTHRTSLNNLVIQSCVCVVYLQPLLKASFSLWSFA